ncbi:DUF6151 family protein [Vibrio penaeicida]|uniref:DUF6151 family protein n=1 Tax=Vibrio penaeicida TaxID=104609 RepID=UPI0027362F87|nr:DUF6151 family protein [Vibrio penaeicida]MDP2573557.1 DUF6151 family protein [Vibrio penaeicida]
MEALKLSCQCGKVTGKINHITPKLGNRLICYCADCRQFALEMDREEELTSTGGVNLIQVPLNHFELESGQEHVACLRLSRKGLYRWYTTCCNTMMGNTLKPETIPFIGILETFVDDNENINQKAGPILGGVNIKSALGDPSSELVGMKGEKRILVRCITKMLGWKLAKKGHPNVLFDDDSKAIVKPTIPK